MYYRYDTARLYSDWLEILICLFARQTMEDRYFEVIKGYEKNDLEIFKRMTAEMFAVIHPRLSEYTEENPVWYDFFGDYYQVLAGMSKQQALGQFFTPPTVVDFMVQINAPDGSGKLINDPACGSGRFLIASHCYNPRNYHFGSDIDYICCQMTALNMAFHGCKGEVVHKNALDPECFYRGWKINQAGPLSILEMKKEESMMMRTFDIERNGQEKEIKAEKKEIQFNNQLNLFE